MPLLSLASLSHLLGRVTGRSRRAWSRDGRTHVEYRDVEGQLLPAYLRELVQRLLEHEDIHRVAVLPLTGRLLVEHDDIWLDADELVALIDGIEADLGVADAPFDDHRPDHPTDVEPLLTDAVQIWFDVTGAGLAVAGSVFRFLPRPRFLDIGWVLSASENFLPLRAGIEERLGVETADLVLGLTNSLMQGLSRNWTSPLLDIVHRGIKAGETAARRAAWERRADDLAGPGAGVSPEELAEAVPERPVPLPQGTVERYSDRAWYASVSGLTASVAATNDLQRSVTPLIDALPKAARLGREAFCARVDAIMAARGAVTMDERALRLLDRVDCVVLPREMLLEQRHLLPGAREILAAARRADLYVVLASPDGDLPRGVDVDEVAETGEGHRGLREEIGALQRHGRVVLAAGSGRLPGIAAADISVGMLDDDAPTPWGAHLIAGPDLSDLFVVLRACEAAREVSRQSVWLALAGSGVGAGAALGGMKRAARAKVTRVVDAAALLAVVNGLRMAGPLAAIPVSLEPDTEPWHRMSVDEVLQRVGSGTQGLTSEQAGERRADPAREPNPLGLLVSSVTDELVNPLTPILAAGAGLSLATGSVADAAMVTSVIGLNATVGGVQRYRAERAAAELDRVSDEHVRVRRDGQLAHVPVEEIVPGDVIELEAGQTVPADCRVVDARGLEVDESALTGESLPVTKQTEPVDARTVADRRSMLYDGTSIAAGEAVGVVVATGAQTEAQRALAATALERDSGGVEARLTELTKVTIPMAVGAGIGTAAVGLTRGLPTQEILDASIGLAVAAVPEGLPILATVAQLAAARRLSEQSVLVRNPRALEALGRVDVVCADKTGTLTEGRIRLSAVSDGRSVAALAQLDESHLRVLLAARRATPIRGGETLPHPTDQAIADGTREAGVRREAGGSFEVVDDVPFEPGRSFHAVLADTDDGRVLAVKGAPEVVLQRCRRWKHPDGDEREVDATARDRLEETGERLAAQGMRVLAVAERPLRNGSLHEGEVEDLTFVGFVGLSDPVRPVAAESVAQLRDAGVEVIMITGDHPVTARGIAAELGLDDGQVLTGPEIDELDDIALREALPKVTVCARVTPAHKVRIVRALQRTGRVVAMTGDGANDAPAIRLADVGIALGKRATGAARDAADIIITEERLEVIVDAIAEGRGLWTSVRDAIAVLVGGNVGEISYTFLGTLVGRRPPLNARQLLLVNLLTDVAPAMALAVQPPTEESTAQLLREGPESSLGEELNRAVAWRATGTAAGATWAYTAARLTGSGARARTAGLISLVGAQLGQTLVTGGMERKVVATGIGSAAAMCAIVQTPGLSRLAGSRPMGPIGWGIGVTGAAIGTAVGTLGPRVERVVRGALGSDDEDEPGWLELEVLAERELEA